MASYAAAVGALHRPPAAPGPAAAARRPRRPARSAPLGAGARASLRSAGLLLAASLLALLAPPAAGSPLGAILGALAGGGGGPAGAAPGPRPFDAAGGLRQGAGDEEAAKGAGEVALEDEDVVQDDRKLLLDVGPIDGSFGDPNPIDIVTPNPSASPTTASPSSSPSMSPTTGSPSASPSASPTSATPSMSPTSSPTSSPTVCANDDSWRKLDKDRDCNYVALNPDKRCGWPGNNGKTANEACLVACGNCPSPAPTPTPPTPGPTVCANDDSWRKLDKDRDCNYVALNPDKRCGWPGNNGKTANEACPVACGNCPSPAPTPTPPTPGPTLPLPTSAPTPCADDPTWHRKDKPSRDCNYVALNPDKRCGWVDEDGKSASVACPVACGTCPSPAPTGSPTPAPSPVLPSSSPTVYVSPQCKDDPLWRKSNNANRGCDYVRGNPDRRCSWFNANNVLATQACPVACGTCPDALCRDEYPTLDLKDAFQPLQLAEQVYPDENNVTRIDITMDLVHYIGPSFTTVLRHFNGGGPGPTIHVVPGGKLELRMINCLHDPIGNLAHNRYQHPNETNMHTHGPHITAKDPGDNVFVKVTTRDDHLYEYVFDENHMPGVFWYHPHLHGSTSLQTGQGSSGLLLMDEPDGYDIPDSVKNMPQIQMLFQHVNVPLLRDMSLVDGDLVTNWIDNNFEITNVTSEITNFMLINFQFLPKVTMEKGKWYRWRVALSSVRAGLAFMSESDNCEFQLLAKDGIFLTDAPREIKAVILSAGNRADVAVRCNELGQEYINSTEIALDECCGAFTPGSQYGPASNESYDNPTAESRVGNFMDPQEQPTFLVIDVIPNTSPEDEDLATFNAPTPCYLVDLQSLEESEVGHFGVEYGCVAPGQADPILPVNFPVPDGESPIMGWPQVDSNMDICGVFGPYGIGANNNTQGPQPGWGANLIPWVDENTYINDFATGSVQQIELVSMQFHPYHQHINPFQIIEINTKNLTSFYQDIVTAYYQEGDWHDTLQFPSVDKIAGAPTAFEISIRFQADQFTGHMVQHCHLLFHEDQGMMAQYDVTGVEGAYWMGARDVDPQCILPQGM